MGRKALTEVEKATTPLTELFERSDRMCKALNFAVGEAIKCGITEGDKLSVIRERRRALAAIAQTANLWMVQAWDQELKEQQEEIAAMIRADLKEAGAL